jgi:hypothetical protein
MNDDANGAWFSIRWTRVLGDLSNFVRGEVTVGEGAAEFQM